MYSYYTFSSGYEAFDCTILYVLNKSLVGRTEKLKGSSWKHQILTLQTAERSDELSTEIKIKRKKQKLRPRSGKARNENLRNAGVFYMPTIHPGIWRTANAPETNSDRTKDASC